MDRLPASLPINGVTWSRAEVLRGPERRRRWTLEQKALIVAEGFAPGVVTSSVARRHDVHPNQLYAWRRELREAAAHSREAPLFAPVVVSRAEPDLSPHPLTRGPSCAIEVEIAGAVVRVTPDSDLGLLTLVARALKAAA
jgi:transposase